MAFDDEEERAAWEELAGESKDELVIAALAVRLGLDDDAPRALRFALRFALASPPGALEAAFTLEQAAAVGPANDG